MSRFGGIDVNITVPANSSIVTESGMFDYARLISCDTLACPIIQVDDGDKFQGYIGWFCKLPEGQYFNRLRFINPTANPMQVVAVACIGEIGSAIMQVYGEIPVRMISNAIESPPAIAVGDSVAVPIAAVNGQRELIVQNVGMYNVWWGDANVNPSSNRGLKISPDSVIIINTSATVYFKAQGAGSIISVIVNKSI